MTVRPTPDPCILTVMQPLYQYKTYTSFCAFCVFLRLTEFVSAEGRATCFVVKEVFYDSF